LGFTAGAQKATYATIKLPLAKPLLSPAPTFLRFAFAAEPVRHHPERPLDRGIERTLWLTPAELRAAGNRLRSPLVLAVVDDWLAGARLPLSALRDIA
jgi:hypothetical protein